MDPDADLKSPISLVHEVALKRGFGVSFEVLKEAGPPHMRVFVTQCIVGDTITEGEGNSKKVCYMILDLTFFFNSLKLQLH